MKQTHKIQKQSLLLNFTNEAEAMSWNRSASEFNQTNILPVLVRLFDHYAGKEEHFEIDKLEINIGSVTKENFLPELEKELKKKLDSIFQSRLTVENDPETAQTQRHFSEAIKNRLSKVAAHADRTESSHWTDTFSYFLDYGILPWNSRVQTIKTLEKQMTDIISRNGTEKFHGLRQQLTGRPARKRLYNQFTADFNFLVLSGLFVSEYKLLLKLHKELSAIFTTAVPNEAIENKFRHKNDRYGIVKWMSLEASSKPDVWPLEYIEFYVTTILRKDHRQANELLNNAVQLSVRRRNTVTLLIIKYLKNKEFGKSSDFKSKEKNHLTRDNKTGETSRERTSESQGRKEGVKVGKEEEGRERGIKEEEGREGGIKEEGEREEGIKEEGIKEEGIKEEGIKEEGMKEEGGREEGMKEISGKEWGRGERISLETGRPLHFLGEEKSNWGDFFDGTEPEISRRSRDGGMWSDGKKEGELTTEQFEKSEFLAEPDFYYVSHSGVLLAWPYLSPLFRILGFTENNRFKNEHLQHRAVHLLAFAATGKVHSEEPQLLVAKLLCGMPLHMPVVGKSRLKKKEKDEAVLMLENLIANWAILKNTSVEGLRSSFFAREGKLNRENGPWKIIVEQKSFDMLLDHLPYPISIIKLPWMDDMLKVDWM
ncbi:hypothetical protein FEM33_14155 [Dyadobacter flavalbus]|uniref:Uncharacterized protein n=1 Tax=Dyadobacter flavalbus TaxID=2579942 RepID=A0A5M8QTD8_9BACT|nr:contractile injection system tape measure protein [Dyadobacter flavalbus]KAA6439399.1 hypothetical protein FEM33_14155 [Dyadobacter flavalbus]